MPASKFKKGQKWSHSVGPFHKFVFHYYISGVARFGDYWVYDVRIRLVNRWSKKTLNSMFERSRSESEVERWMESATDVVPVEQTR